MYCKYCGKQIEDQNQFCRYCGKPSSTSSTQAKHIDKGTIPRARYNRPNPQSAAFIVPTDEPNPTSAAHQSTTKHSHAMAKMIVIPLVILIPIVLVLTIVATALFSFGFFSPKELSASEIAKLSDSVLTLYVYDENHELLGNGSGFIVQDDKTLITNYHVIDQAYYIDAISNDEQLYTLEGITFYDEETDVAVLRFRTSTGLKPLPIKDSSSARVGDTIYAIGSPLGLSNTVSDGIISAIRDDDIQITAPISPGSSGGALLNTYGEVIGITYGSYTDGQNLNLAIPSAIFSDKLQGRVIQPFEDVAVLNAPLGNTVENYSVYQTRLVQYQHLIFESYNSDNTIYLHDTNLNTTEQLEIDGTNLSVYRGRLYYVSDENKIGTYDIETGTICHNILENYQGTSHITSISDVFVTRHGISVIYKVNRFYDALIQLDFENSVIGTIDQLPSDVVVADADNLVGYDYKNWELEFISLSDLQSTSVSLDFEPGAIYACSDGVLYVADTTYDAYGALVKCDMNTGVCTPIERQYASTYKCFVYDNQIFYPAWVGTIKISANGSDGTLISDLYALNTICFTNDGTLYAIGSFPIDPYENDYSSECVEFYIRMNPDGGETEILDNKLIQ